MPDKPPTDPGRTMLVIVVVVVVIGAVVLGVLMLAGQGLAEVSNH